MTPDSRPTGMVSLVSELRIGVQQTFDCSHGHQVADQRSKPRGTMVFTGKANAHADRKQQSQIREYQRSRGSHVRSTSRANPVQPLRAARDRQWAVPR